MAEANVKVMLNGQLMFPSEYLSAVELQGRDVTLTIHSVEMEELRTRGGSEDKPVIRFVEMEERHRKDRKQPAKRLVTNRTNARTIAKLYGANADEWAGKRITIYPTTCAVGGEMADCIRIRPTVPGGKGSKPKPSNDEPSAEEQREIEQQLREENERNREAGT